MKKFRSFASLLMALALLLTCLPMGAAAEKAEDDFVPVLRFLVTSDVHIRNNTAALNGHEQLSLLYETAYAYSENHPVYNKLDGMFFIGDNTQGGSEQQQTYFFNFLKENTKEGTYALATMGNHEFKATGQNYNDPEGATAKFLEYSGYETTDTRFELGGYQFIAFAPDLYDKTNGVFFTQKKLDWLKKELDAAVAATPDKPIFVMQHQPPYQTMKGSNSKASADPGLKNVLVNYPQVIDFSGHTHCSLSDPRIIWQGEFTAINTGGMAYLSIPIMNGKNDQSGGRAIDEEGGWIGESEDSAVRNAGMYYFVEVDKDHRVQVLTYNTFTKSLWGEPYLIDSLDPADFVYTNDRKNNAVKPTFAQGAALQLRSNNYKNLQITIPHATCKDVVQSYRVEVYQGNSLKQTLYRGSNANYGEAAPAVNAYIKNLQPNTDYTIKVFATSSYNLDSDPLTLQVKTSTASTAPKADVLDVTFQADGTAVNAVTGLPLKTYGEPFVDYEYALQRNVASFDGVDDAYGFWGISNWYDVLGTSFTLETYAYLEQKPSTENMGILSNLQSAGMGISYQTSGKMYFYVRNSSDGYTYPGVEVEPGSWMHLTCTYDGQTLKGYINGVLVAEQAAPGKLVAPAYMARCMCVGSDVAVDSRQSFFAGKIATAKIYSDVLTAEQVAKAYQSVSETNLTPTCPEHGESTWTEVKAADWANGGSIASGHYVLTEDIDLAATLTVAAGQNVCINLAGYDITASGTAGSNTWYRVFENNGNLTVLDSCVENGVISGGTAWASADYAMGGNIYNGENAVFNLHGGTVSGGKASGSTSYEPGAIGGNIYGTAGSVINIKGGRVENGISTKTGSYTKNNYIYGGNIGSDGTVNVSGGTIADGKAILSYSSDTSSRILYLYGGNIAIRTGGELNVSGGIISGGTATGTRTNEGTTSKSYGRGGNIFVAGGDATISGGIIRDGRIEITVIGTATGTTVPATANAFGANFYIANGDLTMTGGTISGGIINSIAKASVNSTSTGKAEVVGYAGNLYITDGVTANISGGTITGGRIDHNADSASTEGYGGNIYVNGGGILNMSGGVISDGYAYYRGGNIALKEGSAVNLSGDTIVQGGSARSNGANIFVTGAGTTVTVAQNAQVKESGNDYDIYTVTNAEMYMYGGTVEGDILIAGTASNAKGKFAMYGGTVGKLAKSDVIPTTNVNVYNGVLKNLPAWEAKTACSCYVAGGSGYTFWHKNSNDGSCAVCGYDYIKNNIAMETGKHTYTAAETAGTAVCHCGESKTGVVAIVANDAYTTLTEALAADTDIVTMIGNAGAEAVTANKDITLDLNGFDVAGNITVAEGVNFLVKDSQTEDYTVADGKYGKITGSVNGVKAADGYVKITEADGISYHKVDLSIKTVTLRAGSPGLYYTANYQYDEVVARNLAASGVVLSTANDKPVADDSDEHSLYTTSGKSVLLGAILKTDNTVNANKNNARQRVYSRAYLKFTDGSILYSDVVSASLKDVVETVDAKYWESLTETQKAALKQMYNTYADVMANWEITNIKAY